MSRTCSPAHYNTSYVLYEASGRFIRCYSFFFSFFLFGRPVYT